MGEGRGGVSGGVSGGVLFFPGSFDPFTLGHADLVRRVLPMCSELIIGVGYNEQKAGWLPVDERVATLQRLYADEPRVRIVSYSGLTVDAAREVGAQYILRGLRSVKDYEYELHMADVNRQLSGIDTLILFSSPEYAAISSSVVRELAHFGHDISPYLPQVD